jgi:hypothetical protein
MQRIVEIINRMEAEGVIGRYAIAGAVAAYNYIEPSVTEDLDILVSFEVESDLISLSPIISYLEKLGYSEFREAGIVIEGWPVQFLPVASNLDAEALAQSEEVEIKSVKTRVLRPEHLVAKALQVDRVKDRNRIDQFLEAGAVDTEALCGVIGRHGLADAWKRFCIRTGIADPCKAEHGVTTRRTMKAAPGRAKATKAANDPKWKKENALLMEILKRKAKGRWLSAKLPFSEKIERMERYRERLSPFKEARERRKA